MKLQRRTSHTIRELNLVPLIDVLLVVLFFYMIISPDDEPRSRRQPSRNPNPIRLSRRTGSC